MLRSELLKSIVEHLKKVLWIIWNPIATVIHFFYETTKGLFDTVSSIYSSERYIKSKVKRVVRRTSRTILRGQTNMMNTFLNRRVAKFFTFLLQFISFVTTYSGFAFFLGNVNTMAPLLAAIVIQGGCFYMLNYTSSQKRSGNIRRIVLIIILVMISITTSYIGIFNGAVKPIKIIESRYNTYEVFVNGLIDGMVDVESAVDYTANDIKTQYEQIDKIISDAETEIDILTDNSNAIVTHTTQIILTEDGYITRNVPDPDSIAEKARINAQIDRIENLLKELDEFKYSYIQIWNAYSKIIEDGTLLNDSTSKFTKRYKAFQKAINNCRDLYRLLNSNYDKKDEEIIKQLNLSKVLEESKRKEYLESLKLDDYKTLVNKIDITENENISVDISSYIKSISDVFDEINQIVISKDLLEAEKIREIVNDKIKSNYNALYLELSRNEKTELNSAYNKAFISNTQTMPFTLPFEEDGSYLKDAIYSFVIASIIDLLSVLFAYVLIINKKSSLYFSKVNNMRLNREEMLEDCLMYICLSSLLNKPLDKAAGKDITEMLNSFMMNFLECVNVFYFPDEFNAFGYIKEDDIKKFDFNQRLLFTTLQNITSVQAFNQFEILKAINADFDENNEDDPKAHEALIGKYATEFNDDCVYYIVSKNLHVWFCDNFAELFQTSLPFDED